MAPCVADGERIFYTHHLEWLRPMLARWPSPDPHPRHTRWTWIGTEVLTLVVQVYVT